MNFMQFCNEKWKFSALNLWFTYFLRSKMSKNGIIMSPGMSHIRLKRKILIFLDFENRFLPTYLPLCITGYTNTYAETVTYKNAIWLFGYSTNREIKKIELLHFSTFSIISVKISKIGFFLSLFIFETTIYIIWVNIILMHCNPKLHYLVSWHGNILWSKS